MMAFRLKRKLKTLFFQSISESQSKLVSGDGAGFNLEQSVELTAGTSIYVCGTILKNCEG